MDGASHPLRLLVAVPLCAEETFDYLGEYECPLISFEYGI
jgi:hypothetical protein